MTSTGFDQAEAARAERRRPYYPITAGFPARSRADRPIAGR